MRPLLLAAVSAVAVLAQPLAAQSAAPQAAVAQSAAEIPLGKLSDAAKPVAYRLDLTVLPDRPRFSGHAEIDVDVKQPTAFLFLHGRGLKVAKAVARVGGQTIAARYSEVESSGVARLDFAKPVPAGRVTLAFDYDAPFGDGASGLYRIKVGDAWYAWSQFESIDARAAFPSFDEPGFKTPFTVTLTTKPGYLATSNAQQTGSEKAGDLVRHSFAPTRPLPTYLVAFVVGPFASAATAVPPSPERATPLPLRIIGTKPNAGRMDFARDNSGPIVSLLERYFGRAFPFPKLDQIGSPVMPGAMENAGADIYGDSLLFLDPGAPVSQQQAFGMVVAHELAHQWFGDLVTPAWWDDIWLNESFANWMGYRIGNEWRPDLEIGAGAINEAFAAMNIDALKAGRPIHQPIATNGEIDSAFDSVTYGKGGQVVAMIAAYMGDAKFQQGVRLHLNRYAYGNATTDQFFGSLAEAAKDDRVLGALQSFVNQQGVPVVRVERTGSGLSVTQKRYALLGTDLPAQQWSIPFCYRVGEARDCTLIDKPAATLSTKGSGALMPNAGGTGYYRFSLAEPEWKQLIATSATLPPGEALAAIDSLWAAYRAGEVDPALLIDSARAMATNPYSEAAVQGGFRLEGLRRRGMIDDAGLPALRAFMRQTYGPRIAELGLDPAAGVYAEEKPSRQKLRSDMVELLVETGADPALDAKLAAAAERFIGGDRKALDPALYTPGFAAYLRRGGEKEASALFEAALASDDSMVRDIALGSLGATGRSDIARWAEKKLDDPRLRPSDRLDIVRTMTGQPETRDFAFDWLIRNYDALVSGNGIFVAAQLPAAAGNYCSVEKSAEIEKRLRPFIDKYKRGALSLDRTVEQVKSCGLLDAQTHAKLAAALKAAG